ncbi:hypothetical protein Scep_017222 [Stephania cephalantha]|uniref:Uncharacterized protein n=1 Tax=Stephania cephalantha TaxID=152367 RepID=A0AAP0IP20_9MAGN
MTRAADGQRDTKSNKRRVGSADDDSKQWRWRGGSSSGAGEAAPKNGEAAPKNGDAAPSAASGARLRSARRRRGGVVNDVEQRRGGALPDRSIPTKHNNSGLGGVTLTTRWIAREEDEMRRFLESRPPLKAMAADGCSRRRKARTAEASDRAARRMTRWADDPAAWRESKVASQRADGGSREGAAKAVQQQRAKRGAR